MYIYLDAKSRDEIVNDLQWEGVSVLDGVLDQSALAHYSQLARSLAYKEQPKTFGPRDVRQDVSSTPVTQGSPFTELVAAVQQGLAALFGREVFESRLLFNDAAIQRYQTGSFGIDKHWDHSVNRNLIVLLGLDGFGRFSTFENLEGEMVFQSLLQPGSLLLMVAPGFLGEERRPVHAVDQIVGGQDGWRYLLGLRQNADPSD